MPLERAIQRFKDWASNYPIAERTGEWECGYPDWAEIYTAFASFVEQNDHRQWSPTDTQNVLYIIARDNEAERLIDEVEKQEGRLIYIAEAAVKYGERDAKWQIASRLCEAEVDIEVAETHLLEFLKDTDEYVRRRALLALAQTGSRQTEMWANIAWKTGHEYQRIAALNALHQVSSSRLEEFVELAKQDGRTYLVRNAAKFCA